MTELLVVKFILTIWDVSDKSPVRRRLRQNEVRI